MGKCHFRCSAGQEKGKSSGSVEFLLHHGKHTSSFRVQCLSDNPLTYLDHCFVLVKSVDVGSLLGVCSRNAGSFGRTVSVSVILD